MNETLVNMRSWRKVYFTLQEIISVTWTHDLKITQQQLYYYCVKTPFQNQIQVEIVFMISVTLTKETLYVGQLVPLTLANFSYSESNQDQKDSICMYDYGHLPTLTGS